MSIKTIIKRLAGIVGYQIVSNKAFASQQRSNLKISNLSEKYYGFYLNESYKQEKLTETEYLQYLEMKYGGHVTEVSPTIKPEEVSEIFIGNHTGGDRMNVFLHDYSEKYSQYLNPLRDSITRINLIEIGILKGTGLAIWDEYFKNKKIYGFDYDLGNFELNKKNLIALGAFQKEIPTLRFFDQFSDNSKILRETIGNDRIHVVIDDAFHSDESIINTFNELHPYLNKSFTYFIEDNTTAWKKLKALYPNYIYDYDFNQLTIITNGEIYKHNEA